MKVVYHFSQEVLTCEAVIRYQMNPANYREALIETRLDEAEGADILMVRYVSCLPKSEFPKAVPCARFTSRMLNRFYSLWLS